MMKWVKAVKELIKDVLMFLRVRKDQRKVYSPIIDDLEAINALANALNDQIRQFAQKWDLFPETRALIAAYREYYDESQSIYRATRKDILNNLFVERNKKEIDDTVKLLQVHRQEDGQESDDVDWDMVTEVIAKKNPLLGKILNICDKIKTGNVVYIQVNRKGRMFLDILLKYKRDIEIDCSEIFHEDVTVEITESEIGGTV